MTGQILKQVEEYQRPHWMAYGSCIGESGDVFFPDIPKGKGRTKDWYAEARLICQGCPVREACLQFALSHHEIEGVWGGLSPRQRKDIRRRRRLNPA